jgi:DNA repair protein RadD
MTEFGPMPAHFGRRCEGYVKSLKEPNGYERCGYRWTSKACPECEAANDISARYCTKCKAEIVDPNERLKIEFKALKRDPRLKQTDEVLSIGINSGISRNGNPTLRLDIVTPYRSFSVWLQPDARHFKGQADHAAFMAAFESEIGIRSVTYQKDAATGFYRALAWNKRVDEMQSAS